MVERQRLTPALVDLAQAPARGERWISDTKLKGFGLRLWKTNSGGKKAFAIRIVDEHGNAVRRTFDVSDGWRARLKFAYSGRKNDYGLGEYLDDARDWARDEIDQLKGRLTVRDEETLRWRRTGAIVRKIPLGRAAESLLQGMRTNGRSQAYVDRLDKLFENTIPKKLKEAPLHRVSAKSIAKALVTRSAPPGNIRVLRSFVGQIFQRAGSFDGPLARFSEDLAKEFWKRWESQYDVPFPELRKLTKDDYGAIFHALEAETDHWQQALCIRLYFEFGAPLSRLMAGRWDQIVGERWYPYWPDEKVFWFESQERITENARALLNRISDFCRRDFAHAAYWFPSRFAAGADHIKTIDACWRNTLERCRSRYYPLREFALSRRHLNNPSYLISFLRQYGGTFRDVGNAAEVSKTLMARRNVA